MAELVLVRRLSDLAPGDTLPILETDIDALRLVRYCGASGDYNRQHWDADHMRAVGFPGIIVHGWLTFALMCRAATRIISPELAELSSYRVRYHAPAYPGLMRCGGRVASVPAERQGGEIVLDLWAKDAEGAMLASAEVRLRSADLEMA